MDGTEYRVYLLPLKSNGPGDCDVAGGYYGHVPGVTINEPIYCRVSREDAYTFTQEQAIDIIDDFEDSGYHCKAEPPITVTYHY